MRRPIALGSCVLLAGTVALGATVAPRGMSAAAGALIALLDDAQRARTLLPFDGEARFAWHIDATERDGLPLDALDPSQRASFDALLEAALTPQGLARVNGVLALADEVDANSAVIAIFGDPNAGDPWSWRFEGAGVSLNIDVGASAEGTESWSSTPFFIGVDARGEREGVDPLGAHVRLGRELLASFDDAQRARAIRGDAPDGLYFGPDRERLPVFRPGGLRAGLMNDEQRELLRGLIVQTTGDVRPGSAGETSHAAFDGEAFDGVHFVWMGAPDAERFYYRVQSDTAMIEFGVFGAGDARLVWRDRERDFGRGDLR